MKKLGRNDPCPCGSGKKYKQCCLLREDTPAANTHSINALPPQAIQEAIEHHQAGRLPQAEAIYRQILQVEPDHSDALHLSGLIAHQQGKNDVAVDLLGKAIKVNPSVAMYYNTLGTALQAQGKLDEAAENYRQALTLNPNHAKAHYNWASVLKNQGKLDEAIERYHQALLLSPDFADAYNNLGNVLKEQGRLEEAVANYRNALLLNPDFADAHNNLGAAFKDQGKLDEAVEQCRQALMLNPDSAETHNNLGAVLKEQGKLEEAVEHCRKALALNPEFADAHNNLGAALKDQGKLTEAIESHRQALLLKPDYAEAHYSLGAALQDQGKLDEAAEHYRKALVLKPDFADAHNNLGASLKDQGKLDEADEHYRQALLLKPDYAEAHSNLGVLLAERDRPGEAINCYREALSIKPDFAKAHSNLGVVLQELGKLDEAIEHCRQALSLKPDFADAHYNLGNTLKDQGKLDEAFEHYRQALSLKPDYVDAYDNLLFLYCFHVELPPQEYLSLARGWEQACLPEAERLAAHQRVFQRTPLAGRKLRVGYVSGDFRQHAVSYFIERIFAHHDRTKIELFAYSASEMRDAVTDRLQALVDHWTPIKWLSDAAARDCIDADGIDVLIDLSGHTRHNRLGVFARRAAPVQANYLGYFASTGLTEMDYWIGDEVLTPPATDSHFSEQVWRLPRVWVSYKTIADAPEPDWHPADDGTVWLGSFNNLGKLTPQTLDLWARVLHALPEGKLLLKTKGLDDSGNRQRILDAMAVHGISPDRIELQRESQWVDYMTCYNRLDIALDPVGGHGGGTSTCDTLWMGVPVIHALGASATSRFTASMLNAIGHPEWIAASEAEYIDKVVALARNKEQRKALRSVQRNQMAASPLCDAQNLARSLENAYFAMFERWQMKH